jgi:hypothetical protein
MLPSKQAQHTLARGKYLKVHEVYMPL